MSSVHLVEISGPKFVSENALVTVSGERDDQSITSFSDITSSLFDYITLFYYTTFALFGYITLFGYIALFCYIPLFVR